MKKFSETIRQARIGLNLAQAEVARELKISGSYLCDLEFGRKLPQTPEAAWVVIQLADKYQLDASDLFARLAAETGTAPIDLQKLINAKPKYRALRALQKYAQKTFANLCLIG